MSDRSATETGGASSRGAGHLFKVAEVFILQGRGPVLRPASPPTVVIRVGEQVELLRPDGSRISSRVAAIETLCAPPKPCTYMFILPSDFPAEDVPVGTEIWRQGQAAE